MNFLEVRRQTFFNAIAMSALGHKRTFAVQNVISALYPPKADMCRAQADVRFVPIASPQVRFHNCPGLFHLRTSANRLRIGHLVERGTDAFGEFDRIVVRPKMHEEQARLLVEHVAM